MNISFMNTGMIASQRMVLFQRDIDIGSRYMYVGSGKTIRAEIELSRVIRSSCEEAVLVIRLYDLFYEYTRRAEVEPRGWVAGSKWIMAE